MKKILYILSICIIIFSCTKEKRPGIVGSWKLDAYYYKNDQGIFNWDQIPDSGYRVSFVITFSDDGTCSSFSDVPEWHGKYEYDYATRKLKLMDSPPTTTHIVEVSYLDEVYLIMDNYYNGELSSKKKYYRLKH